jgi:glycosyltransferase involved in cell wall biosynthesis
MVAGKAFTIMHTPRVLMIASVDDVHTLRPLNWLLAKGCQVVFSSGFNPFREGKEGFAFVPFPDDRGGRVLPKCFGQKIGGHLFLWIARSRLRLLFRRVRPNIIHVHWVDDRAYYCARAGLRPLVLTVWGSDINRHFLPNADSISRQRVGEALAGADLILVDSADMHEKCSELAGRNVPAQLFPNGIDTERFRPGYAEEAAAWRRKLGISAEATVLLSVRGWKPLYRHEDILEAFAEAVPRLKSEAVLVFKMLRRIGTDPLLYEKEIRKKAENLNVAGMVRWMEEVPLDRLPEIYSFADVILNYPAMDAFPVTFLEAGACECPVISCRLPAYEGTFAEDYFRLISPVNRSELSDAIVDFVNQNHKASRVRLPELRRKVCENHDEKIVAGRLLDIYQQLSSTLKPVSSKK